MTNCRWIFQNPGKHLAGVGKMPWLISLACYFSCLEIQSPTGLALWPVVFTATPKKKQSRHNSGLSIGYFSGGRAQGGHGQPQMCLEWCSMTARCPEGRTELILLFSNCLDVQGFFISLKGQKGTCKEMKRDNQRHRMSLAWGEKVNRVAFFSSKRDVRQERW